MMVFGVVGFVVLVWLCGVILVDEEVIGLEVFE